VRREGDVIVYDVVGTGFLHNMVRNMARALVLAGSGKLQIEDVIELLRRQDRRRLGPPAPPAGLYLMEVRYS
jgi:tRNA pseudouridine38-40 synthase